MELPIFSDNLRSNASWIAVLDREREAWQSARRASGARIDEIVREHQIRETLQRADEPLDERRLLSATKLISNWAAEPEAKLSVVRLLEVHSQLVGGSVTDELFRRTEPLPISPLHDPTPAVLLPRMLDNAFDWFSVPSFVELQTIEQSSIVYLRLLDLHPFPTQTETTALLAASFYAERAGLPPVVIDGDETTRARYQNVLEAAFRMLTQPLVEFFAEMSIRTMRLSLGIER